MILLDTHAWIWWVSAPEQLSPAAREAIEGAHELGVSPISCWELATKVSRGKLRLDRDLEVWVHQALARPRVTVAGLLPEIAVAAGRLGSQGFHGDPADRMIVATAMYHDSLLVTKDGAIREFSPVRTVW
ncbi:MAG TPA: type II toxin-antitoxin system VapC family toxin [Thermoanaerobaculia bacterium]|nr:type II toxin-antitoxin system VapC family toxin [Thermoanaerobaculia bacterium]